MVLVRYAAARYSNLLPYFFRRATSLKEFRCLIFSYSFINNLLFTFTASLCFYVDKIFRCDVVCVIHQRY